MSGAERENQLYERDATRRAFVVFGTTQICARRF